MWLPMRGQFYPYVCPSPLWTDGCTSNRFIRMRNNKMIRHCWCRLKNVKLSLWLPFINLTNPAVVLVSDVTGTDWYVASGRSLSIARWRQLPFAAEALNYSQIIMTVVFGHKRSRIKSSLQGFLPLHAKAMERSCHRLASVRPSVHLSVCPSVTLVSTDHIHWGRRNVTTRLISPMSSLAVRQISAI